MARIVDPSRAEQVGQVLIGAADVDGGPTEEQLAVIGALLHGYFENETDVADLAGIGPGETASTFAGAPERRRMRELLVLIEFCRHPISDAQVTRVEDYAAALGDCGAGTLGRAYVEFYDRNGLTLPGDDPTQPAMFVAHDMCHVIGGYEPVAIDEIGLGAMQLGVNDSDSHWLQFLGNLSVHEAGFLTSEDGSLVPKEATLSRLGAAETFAHAFNRGVRCEGDFTTVDHLALAPQPLEDVRAQFGVPPREC